MRPGKKLLRQIRKTTWLHETTLEHRARTLLHHIGHFSRTSLIESEDGLHDLSEILDTTDRMTLLCDALSRRGIQQTLIQQLRGTSMQTAALLDETFGKSDPLLQSVLKDHRARVGAVLFQRGERDAPEAETEAVEPSELQDADSLNDGQEGLAATATLDATSEAFSASVIPIAPHDAHQSVETICRTDSGYVEQEEEEQDVPSSMGASTEPSEQNQDYAEPSQEDANRSKVTPESSRASRDKVEQHRQPTKGMPIEYEAFSTYVHQDPRSRLVVTTTVHGPSELRERYFRRQEQYQARRRPARLPGCFPDITLSLSDSEEESSEAAKDDAVTESEHTSEYSARSFQDLLDDLDHADDEFVDWWAAYGPNRPQAEASSAVGTEDLEDFAELSLISSQSAQSVTSWLGDVAEGVPEEDPDIVV